MAKVVAHYCPECGIVIRPGDKQCWLCFQKLHSPPLPARTDRGPVAAAPNPFADDSATAPKYYYTTNTRVALAHLLAILAILPATAVAFFTTCTVFLLSDDQAARGNAPERTMGYIVVCCISSVVVFVLFCMLIVSLGQKTIRRVEL